MMWWCCTFSHSNVSITIVVVVQETNSIYLLPLEIPFQTKTLNMFLLLSWDDMENPSKWTCFILSQNVMGFWRFANLTLMTSNPDLKGFSWRCCAWIPFPVDVHLNKESTLVVNQQHGSKLLSSHISRGWAVQHLSKNIRQFNCSSSAK